LIAAEDALNKVLKSNPKNSNAFHLLGIIANQKGNKNEAVRLIRKAIKFNPKAAVFYRNLGLTFIDLGKSKDAITAFRKAVHLDNKDAHSHNDLGTIYSKLGKTQEAINEYKIAIAIDPANHLAFNNLGHDLSIIGKLDEATYAFDKAIQLKPDDAEAYSSRGNVLINLGQLEEAVESYDKSIQLKPDYAEAYCNRGNALKGLGHLEEAVESYDKAIQLKPDYAEAYSNRGNALKDLGYIEEAIGSHDKAIQLKPDYGEAYSNLCEIYDKQNMVAELKNALHQAQEALPRNDPYLLFRMSQLASREKRLEDARDFLELITPEKLPPKARRGHSELLAKTYDKLGQFSNAFAQFEITNEITKQSFEAKQFSGQRYFEQVSQLSRSWSSVAKIRWPVKQTPASQHSLTFLVGFPRSGTTLLDTILRSHPEVSVVEEKPMVTVMRTHIGDLTTTDILTSLDDGQIADLRKVYFDELYSHVSLDSSHKLIVDKLPLNITDVGLIHRVFPDSKFILALRHPYDCVLSCFMQNFKLNDAMSNFLTLQQSAKFYDAIMNLWVHYNSTLDLEVGALKYEDLVQDLQGTVEPLLNFLGLDWHDNLLNYQQTALSRGRIHTPSYNQVTQSLYTQASGRWKNYQDQMKGVVPLLELWAERYGYPTEF